MRRPPLPTHLFGAVRDHLRDSSLALAHRVSTEALRTALQAKLSVEDYARIEPLVAEYEADETDSLPCVLCRIGLTLGIDKALAQAVPMAGEAASEAVVAVEGGEVGVEVVAEGAADVIVAATGALDMGLSELLLPEVIAAEAAGDAAVDTVAIGAEEAARPIVKAAVEKAIAAVVQEAQSHLHLEGLATGVCRHLGMCKPPVVRFGFMNTQHLTEAQRKKAVLGQLLGFFHWKTLLLCEVMESARETESSLMPTWGRHTDNPRLQHARSEALATYLAHEEFTAALQISVEDSYEEGRYDRHKRRKQLQYGFVSPKGEAPSAHGLRADLVSEGRVPWQLTLSGVDLFLLHAPSGNHANARRLVHGIAEKLGAKDPWILVGDLNCSPTEFKGSDCRRGSHEAICDRGEPHSYRLAEGAWVHCPGQATRSTGTLDFVVSNLPTVHAELAIDLATAEGLGFDHAGIDVRFPGG